MQRKKLQHQKRAAKGTCANNLDGWELVYDYSRRRFNLNFKVDMPTLQAILDGLKFKKD